MSKRDAYRAEVGRRTRFHLKYVRMGMPKRCAQCLETKGGAAFAKFSAVCRECKKREDACGF